ncbi:hypothetical protein PSAC2689_70011 [Paraburkholderia sacchari]
MHRFAHAEATAKIRIITIFFMI